MASAHFPASNKRTDEGPVALLAPSGRVRRIRTVLERGREPAAAGPCRHAEPAANVSPVSRSPFSIAVKTRRRSASASTAVAGWGRFTLCPSPGVAPRPAGRPLPKNRTPPLPARPGSPARIPEARLLVTIRPVLDSRHENMRAGPSVGSGRPVLPPSGHTSRAITGMSPIGRFGTRPGISHLSGRSMEQVSNTCAIGRNLEQSPRTQLRRLSSSVDRNLGHLVLVDRLCQRRVGVQQSREPASAGASREPEPVPNGRARDRLAVIDSGADSPSELVQLHNLRVRGVLRNGLRFVRGRGRPDGSAGFRLAQLPASIGDRWSATAGWRGRYRKRAIRCWPVGQQDAWTRHTSAQPS